jgi:hypothetical protein
MRFKLQIFVAALLATAAASTCAHAFERRGQMSMGHYVRQSALIVRGAVSMVGEHKTDKQIAVREVLKGTARVGDNLVLPSDRERMGYRLADWILPREAPDIAVLIGPPTKDDPLPILETYHKPEEFAALPKIIRITALPTERAQLLALRQEAADPILLAQFLADARDMRERENLEILLGFARTAEGEAQKKAVEAVGFIGDARGVPVLIEALGAPRREVALTAAHALRFYFPGAPGVDAAFEKHRGSTIVGDAATAYLQRGPRGEAAPKTLYQKISRALEEKKDAEASALFEAAANDSETLISLARWNPEWLARQADARPEKAGIAWRTLEPWIWSSVRAKYGEPDSWQRPRAVKFLLSLRRPVAGSTAADSIAMLQAAIESSVGQYSSDEESQRPAAFALLDRGEEGRAAVVAALEKRPNWESLRPLFEPKADEGAALIEMLRVGLEAEATDPAWQWAIFRLGHKRERRAVPILAQWLEKRSWNSYGSLIAATLTKIATDDEAKREVEAAVIPLLGPPHIHQTREAAQQVLVATQGERALPFLRRALREDIGVRSSAAQAISSLGTAQDIALVASVADFWSGDRANHYWLQSALSALRSRHGYDVNGPIRRAQAAVPTP